MPPHVWMDQNIWNYISPYVPNVAKVIAINTLEFLVFQGSHTNKEGFMQGEAIALADGMDGNIIHCSPRMLKKASTDLTSS